MKIQPSNTQSQSSMSKTLALAVTALAITIGSASASITFDLRASAVDPGLGTITGGGKTVEVTGASGNITFQLWARLQNAAPTASEFGIQTMIGSVVTTGTSGTIAGSIGAGTFISPFNAGGVAGGAAELSASYGGVADGILDRGSNSTTAVTNYIKFRSDPTGAAGGFQVGGNFYMTQNQTGGATVNPISNGFEFLMGSVTMAISNFGALAQTNVNWKIPLVTSAANKGQIAIWLDGTNNLATKNGNTNNTEMFVGSAVNVSSIPEPSAFGMVLVGALSMVGFRRFGLRRQS